MLKLTTYHSYFIIRNSEFGTIILAIAPRLAFLWPDCGSGSAVIYRMHDGGRASADADFPEVLSGMFGDGQRLIERARIHVLFDDAEPCEAEIKPACSRITASHFE